MSTRINTEGENELSHNAEVLRAAVDKAADLLRAGVPEDIAEATIATIFSVSVVTRHGIPKTPEQCAAMVADLANSLASILVELARVQVRMEKEGDFE